MKPQEIDWKKLSAIIRKHRGETWGLIPLLQEVQEALGYIPPEAIAPIASALKLYPSEVQGVIEFYSGLSLKPKGKHVFKVCCGTACHVKGGRSILSIMKKELGINEGETSPDYKYSLETVACLGACFLAPTMMADKEYIGRLSPRKIESVLSHFTEKKEEEP